MKSMIFFKEMKMYVVKSTYKLCGTILGLYNEHVYLGEAHTLDGCVTYK